MKRLLVLFTLLGLMAGCTDEAKGTTNSEGISASGDCEDPQIKGNLTTYNGEKIYHVPGGQYYAVTEAEEMFCTEEDAEAAGYRASLR